jgi:DNA-binding Lrp family transcriptional regulator
MKKGHSMHKKPAPNAEADDPTARLDRIDRNILRELQHDASLTSNELSRRVALSPTATFRRVERLEAAKYIRKTVALVDPAMIDLPTLVIVGVVLDRSTPESFAQFEAAAATLSGCLECHLVAGEFDYFLMLRTRDLQRFNKLHAGEIINLPGVRQIRSFFVLKEILSTTALPV